MNKDIIKFNYFLYDCPYIRERVRLSIIENMWKTALEKAHIVKEIQDWNDLTTQYQVTLGVSCDEDDK